MASLVYTRTNLMKNSPPALKNSTLLMFQFYAAQIFHRRLSTIALKILPLRKSKKKKILKKYFELSLFRNI